MHPSVSLALRVSLLCSLAFSFTSAQQPFRSLYDKPFQYACHPGRYLRSISSNHDNHREDRVYALACDPLAPQLATHGPEQCQWSDYVNNFDEMVVYQCPGNGYVSGLGSYHSNHHEDRRFKFYCCALPNTQMRACSYTGWLNNFDKPMDYLVPSGKFLRGMTSYHSNHHEDRRFKFNVCELV